MDLQMTKLELIEMLLNTEKESVLNKVRAILEKDQEVYRLTEKDYSVIDKRRNAHLEGRSKSFGWDEVKQQARDSNK